MKRHSDAPVQILADGLGDPLGRAHDVGRVDRLVGRDENEALAAACGGGLRDDLRSDHVVPDRRPKLILQERHMLVGGGVEDDRGTLCTEQRLDRHRVGHIEEMARETQLRKALRQLHLDAVEIELAAIHQDQAGRAGRRELTHQLRADRTPGAGDQDIAPGQPGMDPLPIELDRFASEQILDGDRPQLSDIDLTRHEAAQLGQDAEGQAGLLAEFDQSAHLPGRETPEPRASTDRFPCVARSRGWPRSDPGRVVPATHRPGVAVCRRRNRLESRRGLGRAACPAPADPPPDRRPRSARAGRRKDRAGDP